MRACVRACVRVCVCVYPVQKLHVFLLSSYIHSVFKSLPINRARFESPLRTRKVSRCGSRIRLHPCDGTPSTTHPPPSRGSRPVHPTFPISEINSRLDHVCSRKCLPPPPPTPPRSLQAPTKWETWAKRRTSLIRLYSLDLCEPLNLYYFLFLLA